MLITLTFFPPSPTHLRISFECGSGKVPFFRSRVEQDSKHTRTRPEAHYFHKRAHPLWLLGFEEFSHL